MSKWVSEETWRRARQGVLDQIATWETAPWVRTGGRTYSGADKDEYIAKKLRGRLARIEAAGEPAWIERLHA
jgi:hypothetical protein